MDRIVVIGLGKMGRAVAEALTEAGADVLAVDERMSEVDACRDTIAAVVQADATDPEALVAAGAKGARAAVVAIGDDFESSVLATSVLRELGVGTIMARANTSREERILRLVGATEIVLVEQEVGRRIAHELAKK